MAEWCCYALYSIARTWPRTRLKPRLPRDLHARVNSTCTISLHMHVGAGLGFMTTHASSPADAIDLVARTTPTGVGLSQSTGPPSTTASYRNFRSTICDVFSCTIQNIILYKQNVHVVPTKLQAQQHHSKYHPLLQLCLV